MQNFQGVNCGKQGWLHSMSQVTDSASNSHFPAEAVSAGGREKACNSFVVKILTSKPLGLKILQGILANPAPVKAFRCGGGIPVNARISQNEIARKHHCQFFFDADS
jgi:hypothetical protein